MDMTVNFIRYFDKYKIISFAFSKEPFFVPKVGENITINSDNEILHCNVVAIEHLYGRNEHYEIVINDKIPLPYGNPNIKINVYVDMDGAESK
jgi:hypothetical protein